MTHLPDNLAPQKDLKPMLPATHSLNSAASGRAAMTSSGLGVHKGGENSKKTVIPNHLHRLQPPPPTTKSGFTPLLPSALGQSPWPTSCPHQPMMLPSWTFMTRSEGLLGQGGARLPHSGNTPRDSLCPWTRRGWSRLNPRPKESKNLRLAGGPSGSVATGWERAPG